MQDKKTPNISLIHFILKLFQQIYIFFKNRKISENEKFNKTKIKLNEAYINIDNKFETKQKLSLEEIKDELNKRF